MATNRPDAATATCFAVAVLLGSTNFVAVRYSNTELAPLWGAALRFTAAALVLLALAAALRVPWPAGGQLGRTAAFGVLGIGVCYGLVYWALEEMTAGAATTVLAAVPLVTLLLAVAAGLERLRRRAVAGALLVLAGIAVMSASEDAAVPLTRLVALVVAVVAVSLSFVLAKRLAQHHPLVVNAVGLASGAAVLLVASALHGDAWVLPRSATVAWAVVYLVLPGSVGLFLLLLIVVRRWTPSASSYLFVLFPVGTMLMGALLADEPLTVRGVLGALVVMVGVWVGALSGTGPVPAVPEQARPTEPVPEGRRTRTAL